MSDDAIREAVKRQNPVQYQHLLDLEARAEIERDIVPTPWVTVFWTDAYGHTFEMYQAVGWADAKAECMRRSMTDNGWIAGEHRFPADKFIVVPGHHAHEMLEKIIKLAEETWGRVPPSVGSRS